MSRFDPLHPTHSAIIEIVTNRPGISVNELFSVLKEQYNSDVSIQTLYRTVAQLVDAQVIFRNNGGIKLNLNWLNHIIRLVETAKENYIWNKEELIDFPKKNGEIVYFRAGSLFGLDSVWDHLVLRLSQITDQKEWFEYSAHEYHTLAIPAEESNFYQTLAENGIDHHILIGNTTFLDEYGVKLIDASCPVLLSDDVPFPREGYLVLICGDYIIESIMPEALNNHFKLFYESVNAIEDFDSELFNNIFRMKAEVKLSMRKSSQEAEGLRAKLRPYFS